MEKESQSFDFKSEMHFVATRNIFYLQNSDGEKCEGEERSAGYKERSAGYKERSAGYKGCKMGVRKNIFSEGYR